MFNRAIDLLYQAKQHEIEIVLNEDQLHLKLPRNKTIDKNLIEAIKINKKFIIDFLKNNKRSTNNYQKIEPFDRETVQRIPLSFSQERLWFVDQMEGSVQYHSPSVLRLKGKLDQLGLEYALQQIVERHEVLRTVFFYEDGQVYQHIKNKGSWQLEKVDGSAFKENPEELRQYIQKSVNKSFDLSKDFMLRAILIQLSEQEHVLVVIMHHIASDAWSLSIIVKEVAELYSSYVDGREAVLAPLLLQYADYAVWQRNFLQGAELKKKVDYWKQKLEGVATLQLPSDSLPTTPLSGYGALAVFKIDKVLSDQLNELSHQEGTSLYMLLLAVFNVLLYRYSGQEDICVGTSISNRQQHELEGIVGFFVNTLALRSEVSGDLSFKELLQQVRTTTIEAYDHLDVPFEKVVEATVRERDPGRNPLFQVMLVLHNTPEISHLRLGDATLTGENYENTASKFDLTFFITETPNGLNGLVQYSTDLFSSELIGRMTVHFTELLQSIVNAPEQKVGLLAMMGKEEQQKVLSAHHSQASYPTDKTVVTLFEEQVVRTPHAVALVFEGTQLSFEQLNSKANQLAHYLRQQGVQEDELVPLCIERSLEMMVAMLGILKAGAAYVPIDTDFPANRIQFMLQDTAACFVVSSKESRSKVATTEAAIDIIEIDSNLLADQPATNPRTALQPHHLAYVIYTSGSTGNPKGVMIEHRNLVDYVYGLNQKTNIAACKSYALVSTIATDLGNTVIFSSLLLGGALHLFAKETVSNAAALQRYFTEHAIDCLKIVPSHWKALSSEELLLPAKLLVFGGEALQSGIVADIRSSGAACRIVNHYGPTETSIGKLLHVVDTEAAYPTTIPIGQPFSNTQVYVVDKYLQLCPAGVGGQLYIAGDGVARGYLNNEGLTKAKFVTNPFTQGQSLMYATGDLVKYGTAGQIQFLGRIDDQVKIRGYRVEPGEIERVLQQSEEVSRAVVLARDDKQGNKRLVGYVVPRGYFDRERIVAYLQDKLPDYMVPAVLIEIESVPLTANGKIDRKALPDPDSSAAAAAIHQYVAPCSEAEKQLAAIWEEVLEVEQVGTEDNFFELGGHSLLAVRLISAIRKALSVEMPISDIFDYPTISLLSARLGLETVNTTLLPLIEPVALRPEHIPLSFSQERLWFIDRLEGSVQYHVPAVLRLQGKLNGEALGWSLQQIVNRHEVLRSVIRSAEGQPYQYIKEKGEWTLAMIDGSSYKEDSESLQAYIEGLILKPFDLSKDDMLRAYLISIEEAEHVLVLTLHHIASDGWSKSVLVKELVALYSQYAEGVVVPALPQLPVQYADYAIWQRNYLQGAVLDRKLGYWKEKLGGVEALQLPTDYARPAVWSTRGAIGSFRIDKSLSDQLQSFSHQQGVTLYMTLLSAFKVLLYRYSGQQDICVGTPVAGRQQAELEGLIGFFVNTLALRSQVEGAASFRELLQQVKQTTLEAYEHQEVAFEKVVDAVVKERDMSRNPLFQVMFILRNTPEVPELRLGEVKLLPQGHGHTTALFDIALFVTETATGLHCAIEYSTSLYAAATMERLMSHYTELLGSVVQDAGQKVGLLPMLSEAEEQELLVGFNDTKVEYEETKKTIVDLFEEQAIKTPESIVVVFEEEQLTYKELNERANQLAYYLREKGVREETIVPICAERGIGMVVGMLGILKAGGAYVPIDPAYPPDRIQYMLEDTGSALVVSSNESRMQLPGDYGGGVIELDGDRKAIENQPSHNLSNRAKAHNLVYVIYTSGSTGKPKGVMIEHRSLINLVKWHNDAYAVSQLSKATAMAGVSFDAFGWEVWPYLLAGASLHIIDDDTRLSASALLQFYITNKITHSFISTALVPEFIKASKNKVTLLTYLLTGGDKLPSIYLKDIDYELINNYGPTENTVVATYCKLSSIDTGLTPPIGKPIANATIYILSAQQALVPIGVGGEICISGDGLARGYLNNVVLTNEKFVPNLYSKEEGARMYRTGDVGRWLPDGNIEYLGRVDEQVKIRGHRIELGEIESVLQQSGLVNEVVIVARKDKENNKQLTGYVVMNNFDRDAIVSYLRKKLPQYMVPSLWVELDSLPLTPNGKVDRKALYAKSGASLNKEYVAPRNKTEEKLITIWKELLHVDQIGVYDNFFEMGGHSLLVMKMVSYIERDLLVSIPVHALFQFASISELSKFLEVQTDRSFKEENVSGFKLLDV